MGVGAVVRRGHAPAGEPATPQDDAVKVQVIQNLTDIALRLNGLEAAYAESMGADGVLNKVLVMECWDDISNTLKVLSMIHNRGY